MPRLSISRLPISRLFAALWLTGLAVTARCPAHAEPAASPEARVLRVLVLENTPPLSQRRPDGILGGFNVDIGRELCRVLGAACSFEAHIFDGAIDRIAAGEYDIGFINLLRTPERERRVLFSEPYWRSSTSLIGRRGLPDVELAAAARRHRIATVRGSRQFDALTRIEGAAPNMVPVGSNEELWQSLRDGRADLAILPTLQALHFLLSEAGEAFDTLGNPLTGDGLGGTVHIVFPLGRAGLKAEVDKAVTTLRREGVYQAIVRRYFPFDIY